ncbi:MAG: GAF domain-containing protein [Dehalococcoidia bacterium]|nr:GAF domain-containing protein [Dehalococcoidia bacterium]
MPPPDAHIGAAPKAGPAQATGAAPKAGPAQATGATPSALLQRERQQAAVSDLGQAALAGRELDWVLQRAAQLVHDTLQADFTKVLEYEPKRGHLLVRAGAGWPDGVVGETEVPDGADSHGAYTIRVLHPVVVRDIAREARFEMAPVLHELGVVSGASVLIGAEGAPPFGVLEADMRTARVFTSHDLDFLQSIANVIAATVERGHHERRLDEFVFLVSHELRNPLTSVTGFSRRLQRRALAEGRDEVDIEELQLIRDESQRMARTIELLLDMARLERRERGEVVREPVALMQLLRQTVAVARERYPSVTFHLADPNIDIAIDSDGDRLGRILANVVDNAAKYSVLRPEVHVTVRARDGFLDVGVQDACGGLPEDRIERLFDRFVRGDTPGRSRGMGIGLYVSRRLAASIDAEIEVENVPDGCRFTIRLPRAG